MVIKYSHEIKRLHCNQYNGNYYANNDIKLQLVTKPDRLSLNQYRWLLPILIILLFVSYLITNFTSIIIFRHNDSSSIDTIKNLSFNANQSSQTITTDAYPRIVYVFFVDKKTGHNYLYKANFLTQSRDKDSEVVSLKNEKGKLVAYDVSTGRIIPNFNQLIEYPLSLDAAVIYADQRHLIIKNKVEKKYQLEMLDPYTGNVYWTLSNDELPGIAQLATKDSLDGYQGIELVNDHFKINIPPYYYFVDKKGQIVDFGLIN